MTNRLVDELARIDDLIPGPDLGTDLEVVGDARFSSAFDVDTVALASTGSTVLALGHHRLDRDLVAATFGCHVTLDGEAPAVWADLSGYYETADGATIQFHANFDHHRAGIVRRLGCEPERSAVEAAVRTWNGDELEAALIADGMVAARLRTLDEWSAHPHGRATVDLPLISVERIGDGPPRRPDRRLRVLDCSRVLAGPVAGQALASEGHDVLRVGGPHLPSVEIGVLSTGFGKRNAWVDLRDSSGREEFGALLDSADVWVDAYRPESFAARGFPPDRIGAGGIVIQLSAFDWQGPWGGRRGFDSIVQSTTGVVRAGSEAAGSSRPVPLPVQALDYATGFLAATTAAKLVAHQAEVGGTWLARLSLLRTRNWLVGLAPPAPFEPSRPDWRPETLQTWSSSFGSLTAPRPISGSWSSPPRPLGSSPPVWAD